MNSTLLGTSSSTKTVSVHIASHLRSLAAPCRSLGEQVSSASVAEMETPVQVKCDLQDSPDGSTPGSDSPTADDGFGGQCYFAGLPSETVASMPRESYDTALARPFAARLRQAVMLLIKPSSLPRPGLLSAWSEAFMSKAFHHCPVVETGDLPPEGSSVAVNLGLCLVGNMVRHDTRAPRVAGDLVEKLSLLLAVDYEQNRVQLLKSLCLVSCWDGAPTAQASLYGAWHWIGAGVRLMVQMGLHRRAAYADHLDSACLKRIFWYLHNCDVLQTACWGRPPLLRRRDHDVEPLERNDFETLSPQALVFVEKSKLCVILARMAEMASTESAPAMASIDAALADWIADVPAELQIYGPDGRRRPYYRPASELFILYFVAVILSLMPRHPVGERMRRHPPTLSVYASVAASCIVMLYDEMGCRDDTVGLLPMHGFFSLTATLPLICDGPGTEERHRHSEKIEVLRSVVSTMRDGYGDAHVILEKMNWLLRRVEAMNGDAHLSGPTGPLRGRDPAVGHRELFPFPRGMCYDLDVLQDAPPITSMAVAVTDLGPVEGLGDVVFDYSLMDFFDFDLGSLEAVNSTEEAQ
ncbi:Fungal trans [Geosmithia morbida]|uniref:Fungal trans n=1 Tax=Geosmithia morbida TaxID=1094350 RepID=A0A9P5D7G6_9HYPO|nr:Fungal trans [Geosmithia morbida]KAF4126616.1 Fungal trans [Geosmithia morbida]